MTPTSEERKHSELPWHYQENADAYTHIIRTKSSGLVVQFPQDTSGKAEADARLVVAAVNSIHPTPRASKNDKALIVTAEYGPRPGQFLYHSIKRDGITIASTCAPDSFEESEQLANLLASAPTLTEDNSKLKADLEKERREGRQEWERLQVSMIDSLQEDNQKLREVLGKLINYEIILPPNEGDQVFKLIKEAESLLEESKPL